MKKLVKNLLPHGFVTWYQGRQHKALQDFTAAFFERTPSLADNRFACRWEERWPCIGDATATTDFDAHYLYHPAWAARKICAARPTKHVDIASKLDFVAMLSAFIPTDFYDYRPADIHLSNLHCGHADVLALPFADSSVKSLSCMHVVEHIGLERYGDCFDPQGDLKAMAELTRVLAKGGRLYFVVPVGNEARIQYNAHRIYTYQQVISAFQPLLFLTSFDFICDDATYVEGASNADTQNSRYGCGCFVFEKPA